MGDFVKSAFDIFSRNQKEEFQSFVGETIEVSGNRFKIKKFLAAGGFSNVYIASNGKGDNFAVKRIIGFDKEGCEKILKEVNIHKKIKNEYIIHLYGASTNHKVVGNLKVTEYLLLTELCPLSLVDIINEEISTCSILTLMLQATNAVNYLHNEQPAIIHRDIKLENFLISQVGMIKLCDFGSATIKIIIPSEDWSMQKRNNLQDEIFINTSPMYRAPEILDTWNNFPIGPKIDIWSLGCVFYCILFKKHPFEDASKLKIINGNFSIPSSNINENIIAILKNCLNINPYERIGSETIIGMIKSAAQNEKIVITNNIFDSTKYNSYFSSAVAMKTIENSKENCLREDKSDESVLMQSLINTSGLLSSLKDGASEFFKNIIVSSTKTNNKKKNIYNLTGRIFISYETDIEILQKFFENSFLLANISIYNFSCVKSRMPPPVRTINIDNLNKNSGSSMHLEPLLNVIEEMFGFLNCGEKHILILQDEKLSNLLTVVSTALFLFAGLTDAVEDALQIFAIKVFPTCLSPSEFRYLKYIQNINKEMFPHNKNTIILGFGFKKPYQISENINIIIKLFENSKLITTPYYINLTNDDKLNKLEINHKIYGNIMIALSIYKNSEFYCVGNIQFHTGFLNESENSIVFSHNDIDLEGNMDFNCSLVMNYTCGESTKENLKDWSTYKLEKDPKILFKSLYEYKEIIENFVCRQDIQNENENIFSKCNDTIASDSQINKSLGLLDLSFQKSFSEEEYETNKTLKEENITTSNQLIDIFDQPCSFQPYSPLNEFDPSFNIFSKEDSAEIIQPNSFESNAKIEIPKISFDDKKINSQVDLLQSFSKSKPEPHSIRKKSLETPSDIFADLLGEQGYIFPKNVSTEAKSINELRREESICNMDSEHIKIFKWTEGKRANIRALLCSMHEILWEDIKWTKCEMHQLLTVPEVKKAYRKACLSVHPDKHMGTDHEQLSKMIFMELNTAWSNFNSESL